MTHALAAIAAKQRATVAAASLNLRPDADWTRAELHRLLDLLTALDGLGYCQFDNMQAVRDDLGIDREGYPLGYDEDQYWRGSIPWGNADPVDAMFRTIAEQGRRAHLDTLTPERRAELEETWK